MGTRRSGRLGGGAVGARPHRSGVTAMVSQAQGTVTGWAVAEEAAEQRMRELKRENRELKRASEILRRASAWFAAAELDRRPRGWSRSSTPTAMNMGSSRSALRFRSLRGPGRPRRRQRPFPTSQGLDGLRPVKWCTKAS